MNDIKKLTQSIGKIIEILPEIKTKLKSIEQRISKYENIK